MNIYLADIDMDLLYRQKYVLLEVILEAKSIGWHSQDFGDKVPELLDGLVNLIDYIGDIAEEECGWTYPSPANHNRIIKGEPRI